jgi:hypothetical protein
MIDAETVGATTELKKWGTRSPVILEGILSDTAVVFAARLGRRNYRNNNDR